ncbi:GmrSD restriction endonuclease domain-containing protein [Blastococcus brunescens]|uniref:DUF1524 domain-containing protein n=1 Tax=Blastococcus brunescens TaxID=1564165 RepID=A0ABZ1BAM6_9ACTN|nr:DUF1524 domain-containing protein [Blastococcus sp. BMG 8361]WRL66265.1 DUF1524 domain-containing protein [Blastococcus sp. BMG 8361]
MRGDRGGAGRPVHRRIGALREGHRGRGARRPRRPLAAAWVQGAAAWSDEQREVFANDPSNLLATTRSENSSKADSTAEEWVPSDPSYGCSYATVVVTVKTTYALSVSPAESEALRSLLATC